MTAEAAIDLFRNALMTTFWLAIPLLGLLFAAGIVISLIQIITSIQEPSFGTVPRLAAFLVGLILLIPWMTLRLTAYTAGLLGDLGKYAR